MMRCIAIVCAALGLLAACTPTDREPVRGVWVPDPEFSHLLDSREAIEAGVAHFDELGLNTIFLCVYAKTATAFPSRVYLEHSTFEHPDRCCFHAPRKAQYRATSPTGDPVRDLIDAAHRRGMRVVFWFEFGFMATHGPTPADHPLLAAHPEWQSAGHDGGQANYNGTDYYLNGYHPGFQRFLLDLIEESLRLYPDVDGIQGDDRLPAMPRDSGYDAYTSERYRAEHAGADPPADCLDAAWTAWRLDILNGFARELHRRVKAHDKRHWVCFSPNPYPWCRDHLMQDYPTWMADGIVDLLSVQCYRFDEKSYARTLDDAAASLGGDVSRLNPGIILRAGTRTIDPETLRAELEYTQSKGCCGATFFYDQGLTSPEHAAAIRAAFR